MERVRGRGLGAGMALGTAAVVRMHSGLPMLPPVPQHILAEQARHHTPELPDVILIADDYDIALSVARSLPWGRVVGIAASVAYPNTPVPALPAVVDAPGIVEQVPNDTLILLDAGRGLILIDPDAIVVAQYQAEAEHIAPKRRLFLDDAHLPAQTLDGRTIQVIAEYNERAVESGADALYLALQAEPIVFGSDLPTVEQQLEDALSIAAGKTLFVVTDAAISPVILLQAAAQVDMVLVVSTEEALENVAYVAEELRAAETACQEQDILCSMPMLAAQMVFRQEADWPEDRERAVALVENLVAQGATRLILYPVISPTVMERFAAMVATATSALVPLYVYLGEFTLPLDTPESAIRLLIGAGAAGIITYDGMIQQCKDIIRESNAAECREELLRRLQSGEETA